MIVNVPSAARSVPPLMGASKKSAPFAQAVSAQALEVSMPTVLWSTNTCPGRGVCNYPVLAEKHQLRRRYVGQTGQHHVRLGRYLGSRAGRYGPLGCYGLDAALAAVVHREREAGAQQPAAHRQAHPAQSNEANSQFRHVSSLPCSKWKAGRARAPT